VVTAVACPASEDPSKETQVLPAPKNMANAVTLRDLLPIWQKTIANEFTGLQGSGKTAFRIGHSHMGSSG